MGGDGAGPVTTADEVAAPTAIELRDIVKRFPGVVANDGVDLTVRAGTIHAIVGENGAGKSTLMKTLYGAHRPDEGTVVVEGRERHFRSPGDAIDAGIGMVFQHFMLADNFTVWENIVLGSEPGNPVVLDVRGARRRIRELSERYGLDVEPDELVADLGVGDKQRVEILKVLYRGARILILDEPTAVLVPHEVGELFGSLRDLTSHGATVVFISHKLDEVLGNADAITVIRAGRTVGEIDDPSTVTARQLAELMVGSELPSPETRERTVRQQVLLEVRDLTVEAALGQLVPQPLVPGDLAGQELITQVAARPEDTMPATALRALDHASFSVHAGEIVGVAGVEGNGQTELVEAILGLREATGHVFLEGDDLRGVPTSQRRLRGVGYVPEDRQRDGMVLAFPLWENVLLGHQGGPPFVRHGFIDRGALKERTTEIVTAFDVRTPGIDVPAFTLSGGNQQKLIVGREMLSEPRVLVAAHPTRGVDVGAQAVIWDILRDARAQGLATLLVSADLEELIGLSDRLLVMLRGRVVAELDPSSVTPAELGSYMTGAAHEPPVDGDGDADGDEPSAGDGDQS
jgi:general nucleoside transport system ATP-binding protein